MFYGLNLYNKINNSMLGLKDLMLLRSDGHFTPVYYIINQFLPNNYLLIKLFIYTTHVLEYYLYIKLFYFIR